MLRFIVISLSTLLVLGTLFFFLVYRAQPMANVTGSAKPLEPTEVSTTQNSSGVGPGYKPWVNDYENGVLQSQFTAKEFLPQKDGSFLVDHPISIFYLDKKQHVIVIGESGVVNCDSAGPGSASKGLSMGPTSTPRNGSLKHVRVELYSSPTAATPTQWMETDNMHFDNDSPRMYTESFTDAHGNTITADKVPVKVRGEQYEFDGTGMTLKWDPARRLQLLRIDHGQRLEIIDPSKLSLPGMTPAEPVKKEPSVSTGAPASVDQRAVVLAADVRPVSPVPAKPAEPPIPYLAVFHDHVQIKDAVRTLATAELMNVNFLQGSGQNKPAGPVQGTADRTSNIEQPTSNSEVQKANPAAPAIGPATMAATSAATRSSVTKPVNGPVTIYWTGPLVVTPLKGPPLMPLAAGQSIVQLIGAPVMLTPQGSIVKAASAMYRNPDGAVQLRRSELVPIIELSQPKGGLDLTTQSVDYDPATSLALIGGPSRLQMPVAQKPMTVHWSQQGKLHIIRLANQPNGVDQIDLAGEVKVNHPTFTLDSDQLQLSLDLLAKPGGKPTDADEQLNLLTATGNSVCRLIHPGKPMQGIDSDKLVIHTTRTEDRRTLPREVVADGHVHAFDPDQSLTSGHLVALLAAKTGPAPATKQSADDVGGAVDLDALFASDNVNATLKNGSTARADQLRVATIDGKQQVELTSVSEDAKVANGKGSWLAGRIVHLYPDRSGVSVEGPGTLETIRAASTTRPAGSAPPRPIDVTWKDSMWLDGVTNVADLTGDVTVKNTDAVGTRSDIRGDKAHLDLVDTPKNDSKPTKKPADTQPDAPDAMGGKQLKKLTLTGDVRGSSELDDGGGKPLRRENLFGNQLIYTAADSTALIPGPGKMFMENHKADTGEQAKGETASSRGEIAVQWDKQLIYNQNTQIINIDGSTRVGFQQEPKTGKPTKPQAPMLLDSDHLIITLVKAPTNQPAKTDQGKMQLSKIQSTGRVRFVGPGLDLYCSTMDYDPKTSVMVLNGNADQPGRAVNAAQDVTGTFQKLFYNTATEEVLHADGMQGTIRR